MSRITDTEVTSRSVDDGPARLLGFDLPPQTRHGSRQACADGDVVTPVYMDHQTIWTQTQERASNLAASLSAEQAAATVPACLDWRVKDLVAHMTGVDTDAWNGEVDEDFSDRWTDTHVRQRADASLAEVLAEWNAVAAKAGELFGPAPEALTTGMVVDASVHEQDLRGAIGMPGAKDQPGNHRVALDMFAGRGSTSGSVTVGYRRCTSTPETGSARSATATRPSGSRWRSSSSSAP